MINAVDRAQNMEKHYPTPEKNVFVGKNKCHILL